MNSYVHLKIGTEKDHMPEIIRDIKRHTSLALLKAITEHPEQSRRKWMLELMEQTGLNNSNNSGFRLWQQDNHPIELSTPKLIYQNLDSIHNNPVTTGFVESPEDHLYSSGKDYNGLPSSLFPDIVLVEPMVMYQKSNCAQVRPHTNHRCIFARERGGTKKAPAVTPQNVQSQSDSSLDLSMSTICYSVDRV